MACKIIPLTKGFVTLVDESDYDWLMQWKWHWKSGYAASWDETEKKSILMHRLIKDDPEGMQIDHLTGDTLDNRRYNLRICTHRQNTKNKRKHKNKKSSKYKGVFPNGKRWQVLIGVDSKIIHIGCYKTQEDAARAYNQAAIKYHGKFAKLNIIS